MEVGYGANSSGKRARWRAEGNKRNAHNTNNHTEQRGKDATSSEDSAENNDVSSLLDQLVVVLRDHNVRALLDGRSGRNSILS